MPSGRDELIVLPSIQALKRSGGNFVLTQKYLEGVQALARFWPGPVTSLVELTVEKSTDFDHIEVDAQMPDAAIEVRPASPGAVMERAHGAAAVLGTLNRRDAALAPLCLRAGLPLIFVTEYTPSTEMQIVRAGTRNPLLRLRRKLWLARTTVIRNAAARQAAALQCSGTPTFEYYADMQPNRLLFFDNRLRADEILTEDACKEKFATLRSGRPLRLVYGGRFVPMKGVMDLPEVASALNAAGLRFQLDIYGDGPLRTKLVGRISELSLGGSVRVHPPDDFRTGWTRMLKESADVFVCCHPQGDPSSTYPEVMSCGVPIVGYDNEAFKGIAAHSNTGWLVENGAPRAMAAKIIELDTDREALERAALEGLAFARRTAFETTFKARAEHLVAASRLSV